LLVDLLAWLEKRGVEDGPEMNDPSQQETPKNCRQTKLNNRHQQPALKQLPEARNKETAKRGDNIAGGTLACHAFDVMSRSKIDKLILRKCVV